MTNKPTAPSSVEEVVAGINVYDSARWQDIVLPSEDTATSQQRVAQDAAKARQDEADFSAGQIITDAVTGTVTGQLAGRMPLFGGPGYIQPDPNYSYEQHKRNVEEAAKFLPEDYLRTLRFAHSQEHFDHLVTTAWKQLEAKKRLGETWTGTVAGLFGEFLDPVALTTGIGTYKAAIMTGRAANLGFGGRFAWNSVGGAAGAASFELSKAGAGVPVDYNDIALTTAFGLMLGGVFGDVVSNPATRQEATAMWVMGQRLAQRTEEMLGKAGAKVRSTTDNLVEKVNPQAPKVTPQEPAVTPPVKQEPAVTPPVKQEDASRPVTEAAPRIEPETVPDTAPSTGPLTPTDADRLKIVPSLQREGPDLLLSRLEDYQRKFGTGALIKEARENGFKKIPKDISDEDVPDAIVELAKKQIVDRAAAAGAGDGAPVTWESLAARMQKGWDEAAASMARGSSPEEAIQDGIAAASRQQEAARPAEAAQPATIAQQIETLAKRPPEEPIPDDLKQQIADALDADPPKAPGRARSLPTPKNMLANRYHVGEWEGADGRTYRIMAAEENGLGPYRVVDVDGRKVIAKDLDSLADARAEIPGATDVYKPGAAVMRAQLAAPNMLPGPPPKITVKGAKGVPEAYDVRGYKVQVVNRDGREIYMEVFTPDGKKAGYAELTKSVFSDDSRWYVSMMEVDPEYRKSSATYALLKASEAELGGPIMPDGKLLQDGYEHWVPRLPWVADFYRQIPGSKDTAWYSPRRILADRDMWIQQLKDNEAAGASKAATDRIKKTIAGYDKVIRELPPEATDPDNLKVMFHLRNEIGDFGPLKPEARRDVEKILQRLLPRGVRYQIDPDVFIKNQSVLGSFDPVARLVRVALRNTHPKDTAWHEAVHALRVAGAFTDEEWAQMVAFARSTDAYNRYMLDDYKAFYRDQGLSLQQINDLIDEEAVAHLMGEYAKGSRVGGWAQGLYDRTILLFRRFAQAVGVSRWNTEEAAFDNIFRRMRIGEVGRRKTADDMPDYGVENASLSAGAAEAPAINSFLEDPSWKAITDEDVPVSAGFWRFDRAGKVGQAENPLTRLIGTSLLNDTVGKADHSLNPFSADLDQIRIMNQYVTEYNRFRMVAYDKWADDLKLGPIDRVRRAHEFFEDVGQYVAARVKDREYHPAVAELGDVVRRIQAEIAEDLKNPLRREGLTGRPVKGAEDLEENDRYLWRKFDNNKIRGAVDEFGQTGVIKMVAGAIKSAQPDIEDNILQQLSRGYVMGLHRRASGITDEWSAALGESDYEKFRKLLSEDTHLSRDEIESVIARLTIKKPEGGTMENLKRRVLLDESYVETGLPLRDGTGTGDLAFRHLLENNIDLVLPHYIRRASGRIALARVRVKAPRFGDTILDGITEDDEFERLLGIVRAYGADNGIDPRSLDLDERRLRFAYDRIKGVPDPEQMTDYARYLSWVRKYMSTRLLGQVGFAQLGEAGTIVGSLGVKATFSHVPAMRRMITAAGDSRLRNELFDEIEGIGIGVERLHGWAYHNLDEVGDVPFEVKRGDRADVLDRNLRTLERGTYELSGMSIIQQQQERAVAAAVAQKIANMGVKPTLSQSDLKRMAQLGMDEQMLQRVIGQLQQHADTTDGVLFGKRLNRMNLQNWNDLEARAALENAMFRMTRKLVQSGDVGNTAMWMSHPIAQTLFQFRNFTFTAWANQFLYNLHMRDMNALMTILWSTSWAATVRAMQVSLLASTRSDGERWKEKQLSPWELGKAGFSRSGYSSIIPMLMDTGMVFAGQPGQFNARSTGQASDVWFGNPAGSFIDSAAKGIGGAVDSMISGRPYSQAEARQLFGLLPYSNMLPFAMGISKLIEDLPERAPRKPLNQ